jgi:hypothetical protein
VIALDDTRTLKHRRSRAFLKASGCYTATADLLHDRNGWAIFFLREFLAERAYQSLKHFQCEA